VVRKFFSTGKTKKSKNGEEDDYASALRYCHSSHIMASNIYQSIVFV
jgi:hypothetical protein